jgi:hypothetical protein
MVWVGKRSPLRLRLWLKVNFNGPLHPVLGSRCWDWTGVRWDTGYGRIKHERRQHSTHRLSWELHYGAIPAGLQVCHHCDRPCCVNPAHLFLGTSPDNTADRNAKGRQAKGERFPQSVLTDDLVRYIRRRYRRGSRRHCATAIARELGVHRSTVMDAVKGAHWAHVEDLER